MSIGIGGIGVWIAIASYKHSIETARLQFAAGAQQSATLDAQTSALTASRDALGEMLAIARRQRAEEEARVARRPRLEFDFGSLAWPKLQEALQTKERLSLTLGADNHYTVQLVIRNVGDLTLTRPVVVFATKPESVALGTRQFSGFSVLDMVPFQQSRTGYSFEVRLPNTC